MKLEGLSSVKKVASFLGTQEVTVNRLISEGRLGGVLIATLQKRGVSVTPKIKSNIHTAVENLAPPEVRDEPNPNREYLLATESTATIVFTDIVGSTEITSRLGDKRSRALFRFHNEVIRKHLKKHGGIEVKSMGDGFMLTFGSAKRAVACSVAIQKELDAINKKNPDIGLTIRIGMSVGEPIREEEDLFGMPVIQAARISALAQGYQVYTCQIVHSLVARDGVFKFNNIGQFGLKGIPEPQTVYEVNWRQP